MKIYTKGGDRGETDLFGGERVLKNHIQVKAYGQIDAANTGIGMAYSTPGLSAELKSKLIDMMKLMFSAGAEVATSPKAKAQLLLKNRLKNRIEAQHITSIEQSIDDFEERLEPLKSFVLPCGCDAAARLHWARILVRKAEVGLMDLVATGQEVRPELLQFFNRLSDLLFVMARLANHENNVPDILWSGQLD